LALLGLLAMTQAAHAAPVDPEQLARSRQCMSCHAIDLRAYAPSFREIAARHPAAADTEMLVRKIMTGGRQHWGEMPMPPTGTLSKPLSEEEARILVRWILFQK
jgi:cytochrome c